MKLAIVTSHPIQYYGPLFRELARRMDVHVFFAYRALPAQQAKAGFGTGFDWDVDLTSGYPHTFLKNAAKNPGSDHFSGCDTPEIGAALRAGGFTGVLLMGWHLKTYMQALYAAKRAGLPVAVRGDSQLASPRSRVKRIAKALAFPPFLRLFDAALPVGARSRAYYAHYRYPADRLFSSPHCVDTDWFAARANAAERARMRASLGLGAQPTLVLFAGKLLPFKRPLDLAPALASVRARGLDITLMVAGDGVLREPLMTAMREAGAPLQMLGFCNQSQMPAAYAAADMLVLPSDAAETWGLVANEALACGAPIIVSDACGCAPDLAVDGEAGRSFPLGDIEALARAIEAVALRPPARAAIAALSRGHSLCAAADGIEAAFRTITA